MFFKMNGWKTITKMREKEIFEIWYSDKDRRMDGHKEDKVESSLQTNNYIEILELNQFSIYDFSNFIYE